MTSPSRLIWSYRPGDWYAVLGPTTTLLLPPDARDLAVALWPAVDDGAGSDQVLDALLAKGLSRLSAFVLLDNDASTPRLLVRGAGVRVGVGTDGGEELVEPAAGVTTWVERTVAGLTHVVVDLPGDQPHDGEGDAAAGDAADRLDLRVDRGVVRVSALRRPPETSGTDLTGGPPQAAVEDEDTAPTAWAQSAEPSPPPPTEAVPTPPSPGGPTSDGPVGEPAGWAPERPGAPTGSGPAIPPPSAPPPPPAPPGDLDHDGLTVGGIDPAEFARPQPGIPGQPPAPSITRPVARLLFSDGQHVQVDRVVLVGRAPEARRFTSTEQPRLVTVPSPLHEISSTHVEVRPGTGADHGSAVATDLGSTNGTVVVQPGLPPEQLRPGIPMQLLPGAVINLGDGVTIQATRP